VRPLTFPATTRPQITRYVPGALSRTKSLNLSLVRDDLDDAVAAALEHQFPRPGSRLAPAAQPGADARYGGVQSPHPVATGGEAVDNWPDGVQPLHPVPGTGCNRRADGVQPAQLRGAVVAPEPYREPSGEPASPAPACEAPHAAGAGGGGGPIGEFFTALGPDWRLTAAQRARLAPAVAAALNAGWMPQALAAFAGANTIGVRSQYAVLAARLSPAELPPPDRQRPARPLWCGRCDEVTRMLGFDGDAPRPRPRCKPWAATCRPASVESPQPEPVKRAVFHRAPLRGEIEDLAAGSGER